MYLLKIHLPNVPRKKAKSSLAHDIHYINIRMARLTGNVCTLL